MQLFTGYLLLFLAGLSALVTAAAVIAGILAWNAQDTLAAVESIFGSLIAALMFAVLSRALYRTGRSRLANTRDEENISAVDEA